MAPIVASTEVARPAEEAFAYVHRPERDVPVAAGRRARAPGHACDPCRSRCTTIRRIGGREREVITEITEYDPPRR